MPQNLTCKVCNKNFNSEEELREHERTAHAAGKKEGERPQTEPQRRDDKIAS
jgi:hypothetical protein